MKYFFAIGIIALFVIVQSTDIPWPPKKGTIEQIVDHFNFGQLDYQATFSQVYFYDDRFWDKTGPVFFYTGNEGELGSFWNNTGFMFDIAPAFKALIIFGEHRYYGESLPYGPDKAFTQPYIQFLSVEQAIADFAIMIDVLKVKFAATKSPVISFGGSYGGMLSAYMRFKYPNVVAGAIAASSPFYWISGLGNPHKFFEIITQDANNAHPNCVSIIKTAYTQIATMAKQGQKGLDALSKLLSLCTPLKSAKDVDHMLKWSRNAWVMMAMMDYPYEASFMGHLPANPVEVACKNAVSAAAPIVGLRDAVTVFYNATHVPCFNISDQYIECADITGCGLGPASKAWDFQACTEMALYDPSNSTAADMFPSLPLTQEAVSSYCKKQWGVARRQDNLKLLLWGANVTAATNIVFSNGNLDPWHGGGFLKNQSESLVALIVDGGAHHLDLRSSNPKDPKSVIQVRTQEVSLIKKWIADYKEKKSRS